jgi:hypothetical protein
MLAPPFLNSALDRVQWSASRSGRFIVGYIAPGTHVVCLTAGLDVVWKRKINCPYPESKPESLVVYPIAYHCMD